MEGRNKELISIVKELKDKNIDSDATSLRVLSGKISHMIDDVRTVSNMNSTQDIIEYVNKSIYQRTGAIDGSLDVLRQIKARLSGAGITVKEAQAIIDEAIASSHQSVLDAIGGQPLPGSDIKNTTEWIESLGTRLEGKVKSIAKCIAETEKKHVKSNIDGLKRWTGLGVSLAILPLTCELLNRIYPWFMDKAFPQLSTQKTSNNDNKKAEVK